MDTTARSIRVLHEGLYCRCSHSHAGDTLSGNPESAFQEHKGAIIGGAVGGAVLIIALATGCICFIGRQRKKRRMESRSELHAQQSPQELYAPKNHSAFQHNVPSATSQQSPVQLPAERYQSPIEIGGHEIASRSDPYGSATTEKSTYSYNTLLLPPTLPPFPLRANLSTATPPHIHHRQPGWLARGHTSPGPSSREPNLLPFPRGVQHTNSRPSAANHDANDAVSKSKVKRTRTAQPARRTTLPRGSVRGYASFNF